MKNNNVKNIKNTKNKNINSRKPKHQKKNIKKNVTRKKNTVKTFTSKLTPNTCKLITKTFMDMLVVIKLYHWKTMYLTIHLATDELYKDINKNIDRFMELLIGKTNYNIKNICFNCFSIQTKHEFIEIINGYIQYLRNLSSVLDSHYDSELITIRDEIIGDFLQLIYLARLK